MQSNSENFQRLMEKNGLSLSFDRMAIAELTFADGSKAALYQARSPADWSLTIRFLPPARCKGGSSSGGSTTPRPTTTWP